MFQIGLALLLAWAVSPAQSQQDPPGAGMEQPPAASAAADGEVAGEAAEEAAADPAAEASAAAEPVAADPPAEAPPAEPPAAAEPVAEATTTAEPVAANPPAEATTEVAQRQQSIARYERQIREREAEHGVYDPATGEYLLSVGLVHQQEGNHSEAVQAFNRALQIKRVNEGLHGAGQVIILEQLLKSNIAAAAWEEVDRNYHQLLWVHKRNYDLGDPRLLPVIDMVGRWKLKAYKEDLLEDSAIRTIGESEQLFSGVIAILQRQYGEHDPRLIDPLYGRALTNYQYAIEVANAPQEEFHGAGSPTRTQVICRTIPTPNGGARRICNTIRVPDPTYYASQSRNQDFAVAQRIATVGRSLKQIVKIHEARPDLPVASHARALAHLADWFMLRGKRMTAYENYKTAYRLLADAGEHEAVIEELFGAPRHLPALRLPLPQVDKKLEEEKKTTTVLASFDVSGNGRPKNIRIIESDPENATSARRRAKKTIRARLYRPRFENGEPVATTNNKIRIVD